MSARVRVLPRAREQAKRAAAWWKKNRPLSPALFRHELKVALKLLATAPEMGAPYEPAEVPGLRRVVLRQTRYHVYYTYDEAASEILVLAVWSALRGQAPPLQSP